MGDYFGSVIAGGVDIAILGALGARSTTGAAFVFKKTEDGWGFVQHLTARRKSAPAEPVTM